MANFRRSIRKGNLPNQRIRQRNTAALVKKARHAGPLSKRARGGEQTKQLPFVPPEDWHEPVDSFTGKYKVCVQDPGPGFVHIVTPQDVRERLGQLPQNLTAPLQVVQLSGMTRKKRRFPCYGMQWGAAIYLYPLEEELAEYYDRPPLPSQINEAHMYGVKWEHVHQRLWKLQWSWETIRDFYLNNVLIHELGHLLDDRNSSYAARERYAEWFAYENGYKPSRNSRPIAKTPSPVRRHRAVQWHAG